MPYLVAAVVVVGLLALLNLLLTVGVIRRLREHTQLLPRAPAAPSLPVGEVAATTTDGESLSTAALTGETVVGFFSPGCGPCEAMVPEFAAYAADLRRGREQALAVVVGPSDEAAGMAARLAPVARVVVEDVEDVEGGSLAAAFRVDGFPALFVVDGGRVTASALTPQALPAPTGV